MIIRYNFCLIFSTARQNIFINLLSNLWKINVSADFKGGLFLQLAAFVTLWITDWDRNEERVYFGRSLEISVRGLTNHNLCDMFYTFKKRAVPDKGRWFLGKVKTSFHEKRPKRRLRYIFFPLVRRSLVQRRKPFSRKARYF